MRTIIGFLLLAVSFFGTIFFINYNGTMISHPTLWYVAFITLGILGRDWEIKLTVITSILLLLINSILTIVLIFKTADLNNKA